MKFRHLFLFVLFVTMLAYLGDRCNCKSDASKLIDQCHEYMRQGKLTNQDCREIKTLLIEQGKM